MNMAATPANEFDRDKYVTLGEISDACGVMVNMAKMQELGFEPAAAIGSSRFFSRALVPQIAAKLAQSIIDKTRGWQ